MDAFAQAVANWHDFYIMIGTAAATLVGLLFVSLSLNVDAITRPENSYLRVLAAQAFTSFLNVVMLAVLFLIPDQGPRYWDCHSWESVATGFTKHWAASSKPVAVGLTPGVDAGSQPALLSPPCVS